MGRPAAICRAISLISSLCLLSWVAAADPATDVRAGRDLFEKYCEVCHGADAKGDGPLADELKVAPPDLTEIARRRGDTFPDVEIQEIIDGRRRVRAHGHSEMPVWGRVFGGPAVAGNVKEAAEARAKLELLVAYLRSIQVAARENVSQR